MTRLRKRKIEDQDPREAKNQIHKLVILVTTSNNSRNNRKLPSLEKLLSS